MLSDWDREVSKLYGAFNIKEKVANRYSFLIDKNGIIRFKQISSLIKPRKIEDMINKLKEINNEK